MNFVPPESLWGFAVVPLVIALVQVVKGVWSGFNVKYAPLVAVGFGVLIAVSYALVTREVELVAAVIWGLLYGLSAVGLYSGTKNVSEGLRQ